MPPPNTSTEQTQQLRDVRHLVVLVRYTPALGADNINFAEGLAGGIAGKMDAVAGAVESAAAAIPGLNLFISEEKAQSKSDTEYTYFKKYGEWDQALKQLEKGVKQMTEPSKTLLFEFSDTDAAGRKQAGQKLVTEINSAIAGWSGYTSQIHFVGLAQGGNVAREAIAALSLSDEKHSVASLTTVATPHYKKLHQPAPAKLKGCAQAHFGNRYDLTQHTIAMAGEPDDLLKSIRECNKGTLKLMTGMLKMRIVKALALAVDNLSFGTGGNSDLPERFSKIFDEIKGIITDFLDLIKKLISEGTSLISLPDIPKFSEAFAAFDDLPGQAMNEMKAWLEILKKKIKSMTDNASSGSVGGGLGPGDLSELLNVLCPVFDGITQALQIITGKDKASTEAMADQATNEAGIKTIYEPASVSMTYLTVDEDYAQNALQAAQAGEPDMAGAIIARSALLMGKAAKQNESVASLNPEGKKALAEAVACMAFPMLPSKVTFYKKLMSVLPWNPASFLDSIKAEPLAGKALGAIANLGVKTPEKLTASIAALDAEIARIKGFVDKNNYKVMKDVDTLYLAYNAHNQMLQKPREEVISAVHKATGLRAWMESQGNVWDPVAAEYNSDSASADPGGLVTAPVEENPQTT